MTLIVNNTNYNGEVVEQLLVRATTTNVLVDEGHVHVHPGIKYKLSLPRVKLGKVLQRRKAMPDSSDSKGNYEYSEKTLEPQDVMAYTEFNPAHFEHIWRPFQPKGAMVFQELPEQVQNTLLSELAKVVDMELGELYLMCKKGAGARDFFDGLVTRMRADSNVIKPSAHAITEANILTVMRTVKSSIPKALRKSKKMKIFMSVEDFDILDYVITEKPFKGADYTNINSERYKGISIVVLPDLPKDVIFAAEGTSGIDSNLWIGVNLSEDSEAIKIGKVAENGELYFFKMLMKADTNYVYGEDIVLWDGVGTPAPAMAPQSKAVEVSDRSFNAFISHIEETMEMGKQSLLDQKISQEKEIKAQQSLLDQKQADLEAREKELDALAALVKPSIETKKADEKGK
jgi:hypothetical protein